MLFEEVVCFSQKKMSHYTHNVCGLKSGWTWWWITPRWRPRFGKRRTKIRGVCFFWMLFLEFVIFWWKCFVLLETGPTGPQMQELSQYTYSAEHYHEVMSMLWKRMLVENKTSWRRVYKVQHHGSLWRRNRNTFWEEICYLLSGSVCVRLFITILFVWPPRKRFDYVI